MRSFRREIFNSVLTLNNTFGEQTNLKNKSYNFNEHTKQKALNEKEEK